jgi:uncharacterized protein YjbJ (UPF0337 family)
VGGNRLWQPPQIQKGNTHMGVDDKLENAKDKVVGQGKEAAGQATDNERLEAEGQADQSKADLKQAGEKVKDAFRS